MADWRQQMDFAGQVGLGQVLGAKTYYDAYGGVLQIDHVVPVENAWVSGAYGWTEATRGRYYNDLGDSRTLVAVDLHDNES